MTQVIAHIGLCKGASCGSPQHSHLVHLSERLLAACAPAAGHAGHHALNKRATTSAEHCDKCVIDSDLAHLIRLEHEALDDRVLNKRLLSKATPRSDQCSMESLPLGSESGTCRSEHKPRVLPNGGTNNSKVVRCFVAEPGDAPAGSAGWRASVKEAHPGGAW